MEDLFEMTTRVSSNRLDKQEGLLREALASLYSLFGILRNILRDAGAELGKSPDGTNRYTVVSLLLTVMNDRLRPFLSKWHPRLEKYEKTKPGEISQTDHEENWEMNSTFRDELFELQTGLDQYIKTLKEIVDGKIK